MLLVDGMNENYFEINGIAYESNDFVQPEKNKFILKCRVCALTKPESLCPQGPECAAEKRKDGRNVIFVKV